MDESFESDMFSSFSDSSTVESYIQFSYLLYQDLATMVTIVRQAQDVSINMEMCKEKAVTIMKYIVHHYKFNNFFKISFNAFRRLNDYYPLEEDEKAIDWIFVLNALNFSLWNPQDTKQWTVNRLTGYKALCYVIYRAIREGRPIWNPNYYSKITENEVEIIFRSDDNETHIALIEERVKVLHEIGKVLLDKYEGTFVNCVRACKGEILKVWKLLLNEFQSYRDIVYYEGYKINFGCKAAALISDLRHFKELYGYTRGRLSAMFVDYCAPRALLHLGILRYSDRLKARFTENDEPLKYGSREDVEIRCCSLVAGMVLRQEILKIQENELDMQIEVLNSILPNIIDNFLWCYRHLMDEIKLANKLNTPFHNIRSIYY